MTDAAPATPAAEYGATPIAAWSRAWSPRVRQTVSEWADAERVLPETSAAKGARWRTSTAPYLRGIMDSVLEPGVRKVALMKCAQSGGSEAILNMVGYYIAHRPSPMLYVPPTFGDAEKASKSRFADMIRTTPGLRAKVTDRRLPAKDDRAESTLLLKQFPGGFLAFGAAGTPTTFQAIAVNRAFGDDIDRWAALADEGDPADLLMNRVRTFHDGCAVFVSTPTLKGGRIDTLYQRSDQRRYHVACPACGHVDWIAWSDAKHFRVAWDEREAASARIECPACAARLGEAARHAMVDAGEWRPTAEAQEPGLIGFHLPAMLSPWVALQELVGEFLSAHKKGRESLRVFVNTLLGEGWEDRGSRVEAHTLRGRLETYGDNVDVPAAVAVLTAGVDVQVDRFAFQVIGWAPGLERYLVEWRAIPGNPKAPETQAALLEAIRTQYRHASGHRMRILATCVDSGYETDMVYAFCLAHWSSDRVYPTKGFANNSGKPIVYKRGERKPGRLLSPFHVNVDDAKAEVLAGLARERPKDWQPGVPVVGYMHLSESVADEGYLQEITAEHREVQHNRSGVAVKQVWVQDRANEALDTAVLCLAALHVIGGSNPAAYVRRQADVITSTPLPGQAPRSVQVEQQQVQQSRVTRSRYLGR